jgi:hypothetical protein
MSHSIYSPSWFSRTLTVVYSTAKLKGNPTKPLLVADHSECKSTGQMLDTILHVDDDNDILDNYVI